MAKRTVRLVEKRCLKCGAVARYRTAVRRCRAQKFGRRSYWCYGALERVPQAPKGVDVEKASRPQDVAQKKLEHARKKVAEFTQAVARATRHLAAWQRKAGHYAKRASMTDAEVASEREKRVAQVQRRAAAAPKRRGIRLGGGAS